MKYVGWEGFNIGNWTDEIDVRDFIQRNYTPYVGGPEFLEPATKDSLKLWDIIMDYSKKERECS